MVRGCTVGLILLSLGITGCYDHLYGPELTNAFGFDVLVTVYYEAGDSRTTEWPVCRTVFFGTKQHGIERLLIEKDGKALLTLTSTEVRDLAKELEDSHGNTNWMVDSNGVHRVYGNAAGACKAVE